MKLGMRHVINRAALAGAFALVSSSAFAQFYQDRRYSTVRRSISASRCAPRRSAKPRRRARRCRRTAQQPQAQAARRSRSEPSRSCMPKGPCFNKEGQRRTR